MTPLLVLYKQTGNSRNGGDLVCFGNNATGIVNTVINSFYVVSAWLPSHLPVPTLTHGCKGLTQPAEMDTPGSVTGRALG